MADVTLFYGYDNDLIVTIENIGENVSKIINIDFTNKNIFEENEIQYKRKTQLPVNILPNETQNIMFNFFSLSPNDLTIFNDLTCIVEIYDFTDSTNLLDQTVLNIDTTISNIKFENNNVFYNKLYTLYYNNKKVSKYVENNYFLIQHFLNQQDYNIFINLYNLNFLYLKIKNYNIFINDFIFDNINYKIYGILNNIDINEIFNEEILYGVLYYSLKTNV